MATMFPSFDPDSVDTLLDSKNAKKVKKFIEAWNNATIQRAKKDEIKIADKNVLITYVGVPDGYVETAMTLCVDGAPTSGKILFKPD